MITCCQTPWLGVRLLAPFVTPLRETLEMLYLWTQEVCLDNAKIVGFLGAEPHTLIHEALRCTTGEPGQSSADGMTWNDNEGSLSGARF